MKRVLYTIVVITLGVCGYLLYYHVRHPQKSQPNSPSHPDQYIKHAIFQEFDTNGRLKSRLKASKVVHFQDKNTRFLTSPQMTTYTEKDTPWHISAQHGMAQQTTDTIYLWGDVSITQRSATTQRVKTTIQTQQVTYHDQTSELETDSEVTITRPGVTLTAHGMTADLKKGIIKTRANSKGRYDPSKVSD